MPNVYYDQTARTLDVYAQVVYDQLFRLSWGHGREWCQIGYPKLAERAGISQNGARKGTRELVARGLIAQIEVDLASSNQADRGIRWRVMLPDGATARQAAPTHQAGATRQAAAARRAPMKDHEKQDMKAPAADAPAGSVYDVRRRGARLVEAHRGDEAYTRAELERDVRAELEGAGLEVDDATIAEALRGMLT